MLGMEGRLTQMDLSAFLPDSMKCGDGTVDSLIGSLYPGITGVNPAKNGDQYFLDCIILTACNDDADQLNAKILSHLLGQEYAFTSADSVVTDHGVDGDVQYP